MRVITSYTSGTTSFLPSTPCRHPEFIGSQFWQGAARYVTDGPVSFLSLGKLDEEVWVCQNEICKDRPAKQSPAKQIPEESWILICPSNTTSYL